MTTPEQLIEALVIRGGAIVSSNDCSEMEIADARATGRFWVSDDNLGYVLRTKPWLERQRSREDEMTRVLEDYARLKEQMRLLEKHAGDMARDADARIGVLAEQRNTEHENYIIEKGLVRIYDAERDAALKVLAELNVRVNSGYDFNADPDSITLLVGAALARERFPAGWAAGAGVWRCAPPAEKETNGKAEARREPRVDEAGDKSPL